MKTLLIAALLGLTLAGYGTYDYIYGVAPRPRWEQPPVRQPRIADTTLVVARWQQTRDRGNNRVARYEWQIASGRDPRTTIRTGVIEAATAPNPVELRQYVPSPMPAETLYYSVGVVSVDSRGVKSPIGWSPYLIMTGEWGPPETPDVQIDTMNVATNPPDSIFIAKVAALPTALERLTMAVLDSMRIGTDTLQFCAIAWRTGQKFMLRDQHPACYVGLSAPVRDDGQWYEALSPLPGVHRPAGHVSAPATKERTSMVANVLDTVSLRSWRLNPKYS